ncbi:MAG: glycosyl hydrolase [Deltaproteobacteria bacterium]|nr:glycosyl hydrolase [Deltaproteobacteria bacterium]
MKFTFCLCLFWTVIAIAKEAKHVPNDWFLFQRTFPQLVFDPEARLRAFQAEKNFIQSSKVEGGNWEEIGPTNIGGRITDIDSHPRMKDRIFIGTACGGVFRSDDGGKQWKPMLDLEASLSIGDIAIDPQDPNTVWAATGEANSSGSSYPGTGIYLSTDGGNSWSHKGLPRSYHIGRVVVDPTDSNTVYVAVLGNLYSTNSERGVYRTHNKGETWERLLFANDRTGAVDLVLNPKDPKILYAATWDRIRYPHVFEPGGSGSALYKSIDGGDHWERLQTGVPQGQTTGRIGIAISPSNPDTLYAMFDDTKKYFNGVYKSTDGGKKWTRTNDGPLSGFYSYFGWWFGNLRVDPKDPDIVYALGLTLYKTSNGGKGWSNINGVMHVDHHALFIDPTNSRKLYSGNDGGFYVSNDGGSSWEGPAKIGVTQFYDIAMDPTRPERLYGGTQDNGTVGTKTGKPHEWKRILGGDGFNVLVDPVEPSVMYAEMQYGDLFKSVNEGAYFEDITPSHERANWNTPILLEPNDHQILYYGGNKLLRSTNAGNSWKEISPDLSNGPVADKKNFGTITTLAIPKADSKVIYAGTDDGNVWCTTDSGANWKKLNASLPKRWVTRLIVAPEQPGRVFVTLSGFKIAENESHVFMSEDFGANWKSIDGNLPQVPVNVIRLDANRAGTLFVGTDVGVYVTHDSGEKWAPLGRGLPMVPVLDLLVDPRNRRLVAGTHGRSMYQLALDE